MITGGQKDNVTLQLTSLAQQYGIHKFENQKCGSHKVDFWEGDHSQDGEEYPDDPNSYSSSYFPLNVLNIIHTLHHSHNSFTAVFTCCSVHRGLEG